MDRQYNWKPKMKAISGRSKTTNNNAAIPCRKHPKHKQSPGVCSVCLSEKLSQLTLHHHRNNPSRRKTHHHHHSSSSSSSSLSSLSSSNASSYASSPTCTGYRKTSTRNVEMLKKSKSVAFVFLQRRKDRDEIDYGNNNNGKKVEKKRGFWSRLLFPRRNNGKLGLMMHSRTTRERVITAVH